MNFFSKILLVLILLFVLVFFFLRGVTFYDEGYILNAALRIVDGQTPYKDFDMVYTPMSFAVTSFFLMVFGESIFAGRIAAFVVALFSLFAVYQLLTLFTKNKWLLWSSLFFFIAWGPTHINFPWPTMFAACFFLYALLFYLWGIKKNAKVYFTLAGIMTYLTFLSKQNFGAGTLLVLLLAFLFIKFNNKLRFLISYLLGILFGAAVFLLYLLSTASTFAFAQNMYLYTLKRVFVDKSLETPFLYEGSLLAKTAKLFFYTSPLIAAITAILITVKSKKQYLVLIPVMTCMFYLLGIRPTTDYVHVVSLLALACLPIALIVTFSKNKFVRYVTLCFLFSMTAVGFYTAYFKGYYQWESPLKDSSILAANERMKIYLTDQQVTETNRLIEHVQTNTKANEYIYVNYYAPMIYFITDRKNPTEYDLISTNQLPLTYQMHIVDSLKMKNVHLVITHTMHTGERGIVADYVSTEYKLTKKIGGYVIYEKK